MHRSYWKASDDSLKKLGRWRLPKILGKRVGFNISTFERYATNNEREQSLLQCRFDEEMIVKTRSH